MTPLSSLFYSSMAFGHLVYEFIDYIVALSISIILLIVSIYLYAISALLKRYPASLLWPLTIFLMALAGVIAGEKYGVHTENARWEALAAVQKKEFNSKLAELNASVSSTLVNYKKNKEDLLQKKSDLEGKLTEANIKLAHSPEMDTISAILHDDGSSALTNNTLNKFTPDQPVKVETKIKYVKVDIPANYCQSKNVPSNIRDLIVGSGK